MYDGQSANSILKSVGLPASYPTCWVYKACTEVYECKINGCKECSDRHQKSECPHEVSSIQPLHDGTSSYARLCSSCSTILKHWNEDRIKTIISNLST